MTERFKQQLKDYADGKLSGEEQAALEREIAKLEAYQEHMEEMLEKSDQQFHYEAKHESPEMNPKKARRLMNKGKRNARFWNVGTVIGLLVILAFLNSVISSVYYSTGKPNRQEYYRDVLSSAVAVSRPNMSVALSSGPTGILSMKYSGMMNKQIGTEYVAMGAYEQTIRMNQSIGNGIDPYRQGGRSIGVYFHLPESVDQERSSVQWNRLSMLPEGTVAEAFVSLDRYYTTDEALKLLSDFDLKLLWLAVYTGEDKGADAGFVYQPLGFPLNPIWHYDDIESIVRDGSMTTTKYPAIQETGDGERRDQNFIDTLKLLQKQKSITSSVVPYSLIKNGLAYVEDNGVSIYGLVITGPSKELLKLQEAAVIKDIQLGEVRLWNWTPE
ncbi:anti-sigma factor [Paenibacillus luteus]|uniref:anti-sigma factor n=1 Tax=Paenibacillus luteus TaxID=2545753 RepID=UPI001142654C|nr:anti-sigma factor [Paenibacillus luteus]